MVNNHIKNHRFTGNTLVYFIVGLVVVVIGFLVVDNMQTNATEMVVESASPSALETTKAMVAEEAETGMHNSIAILPFDNLSPNPDDAYIAFGIHQDILYILSLIQDMSVISHNGVYNTDINYADKSIMGKLKYPSDMSLADITAELNVGTIMKGSVSYADDQIMVDVQLYDASGDNQLWAWKFERDFSEVFAIQAEIAENIAMTLGANLSDAEKARIRMPLTNSIEAYKPYLKARVTRSHLEGGMPFEWYEHMDEAIAIYPDFALAHGFKAAAYGISLTNGNPSNLASLEDLEKVVVVHAEKALAVDPDLSFAHWAQALVHYKNGRTEQAKQAFERALQLGPGLIELLNSYTHFLSFHEEDDRAIEVIKRAQELTPTDASWLTRYGMPLLFAEGHADAAVDKFSEALQYYQFPWLHRLLGVAEYRAGNRDEAIKQVQIAEQKRAEFEKGSNSLRKGADPYTTYVLSILGFNEEAEKLASELEASYAKRKHVNATNAIMIDLTLGKVDEAYDVLSNNLNKGVSLNLQYIKENFMNDPVLEEPRFVEMRSRIGGLN